MTGASIITVKMPLAAKMCLVRKWLAWCVWEFRTMEYNDRPEWVDFDSLLMIFRNNSTLGESYETWSHYWRQVKSKSGIDSNQKCIGILCTCLHQTLCLNYRGTCSRYKGKASGRLKSAMGQGEPITNFYRELFSLSLFIINLWSSLIKNAHFEQARIKMMSTARSLSLDWGSSLYNTVTIT